MTKNYVEQPKQIEAVNDDDTPSVYDSDPRLDDMQPIISSLEFIMREAYKTKNYKSYELIRSAFKMVLIATDIETLALSQDKQKKS